MENNKVVVKLHDIKNVAAFLELAPKRVKQLTDEGIITEHKKGYYRLEKVAKQYIVYQRNQLSNKNPTSDLNTERAQLVSVKRQNEEIELAYKRKQYHKADEVEFAILNMVMSFRSKCMTLPQSIVGKIAGETDPSIMIDLIKGEVLGVLEELQDYDKLFSDEDKEE